MLFVAWWVNYIEISCRLGLIARWTTILLLTNYCLKVFRPRLIFPARWAWPTLISSRVGGCPPCLPRAGAHDLKGLRESHVTTSVCIFPCATYFIWLVITVESNQIAQIWWIQEGVATFRSGVRAGGRYLEFQMQISAFCRTFRQKINSCESVKYYTFLFQAVLRAPVTGYNTKNGTTGVPIRITSGRDTERSENWTSQQKRDRWQHYSIWQHKLLVGL